VHDIDGDPLFRSILHEATVDPATLGIILHGSRSVGMEDGESDYDVIRVLTEERFAARLAHGLPRGEVIWPENRKAELYVTSPSDLSGPATPDWFKRGLGTACVLLDKTGAVQALLDELTALPNDRLAEQTAELFDAYLNGFYRSLKAARRGNEVGARLEAAESLADLVQLLFALEGRIAPYHSRLPAVLDRLAAQGWEPGELQQRFLSILRTGGIRPQQELEERVERLLRDRGYGYVVEGWEGEIERVKAF